MKKKLSIVVVLIVALCIAVYTMLCENSKWQEIPDVTTPFEKSFRDPIDGQINGGLAVHVKGSIKGTAILHTTYGDIDLTGDSIDSILIGHDYWNSKCIIKYEPLTVQSGKLSIRVAIGTMPKWAQKPLRNTMPANYVGEWTTWHANREQVYSQGHYFCGQKKGTWSYWDEQGSLMKTEEWKDGRRIESRTANKNRLNPESSAVW